MSDDIEFVRASQQDLDRIIGGQRGAAITNLDTREFMICQTCRVPLNSFTELDTGQVSWVHSRNWNEYDHEPVPVVGDRKEVDSLCDFCSVPKFLRWVYVGDQMLVPGADSINDFGTNWSACEDCDAFLTDGDLDGLLKRVATHASVMQNATLEEKKYYTSHWRELWENFLPTVYRRVDMANMHEPARLNPRLMPKIRDGLLKFWGAPADHIRRSREIGTVKGVLAIPGLAHGFDDIFIQRYPPGVRIPENVWANHTQHLRAGLGVSEMFWISERYTDIAVAAGKDFTEDPILRREDLPASFGLMCFETPIGEVTRTFGKAGIRALSWTLVPGGVWFNVYFQFEEADPDIDDVVATRHELGYLACPSSGSGFVFDAPVPVIHDQARLQFMRTIMAVFFLLQQPGVAEVTTAPVDKKYARAYQRQHRRAPDPVHIVDLRRRPASHGGTHAGRPMEFRQYRRGHWKQQAYGPKRGLRKNIYVSPYITGTEDMPFRAPQETVRVLR